MVIEDLDVLQSALVAWAKEYDKSRVRLDGSKGLGSLWPKDAALRNAIPAGWFIEEKELS